MAIQQLTSTRRRRLLLIMVLIFAFFLVPFGCVFFTDVDPPDDSDLIVVLPPVAEEDNIVVALSGLGDQVMDATDEWEIFLFAGDDEEPLWPWDPDRPDSPWRDPQVLAEAGKFFERHASLFRAIEGAIERPDWREDPGDVDTLSWRAVSQLIIDRAAWLRWTGRRSDSLSELIGVLDLGDAMIEGAQSPDQLFNGGSCRLRVWQSLEVLDEEGAVGQAWRERLLRRPLVSERLSFRRLVALSYSEGVQLITQVCELDGEVRDWFEDEVSELSIRYGLKKNKTLRAYANDVRRLLESERPPVSERDSTGFLAPSWLARCVAAVQGNWVGLWFSRLLTVSDVLSDRFAQREAEVRTRLALRWYEVEHGQLPAQLQDLVGAVPGFGALPVDPWSGEPFLYDRDRRLIWSVGDDGIDQGAVGGDVAREDPEQSRFDQLDWVWALPKPPDLPATKP